MPGLPVVVGLCDPVGPGADHADHAVGCGDVQRSDGPRDRHRVKDVHDEVDAYTWEPAATNRCPSGVVA